MTVLSATLIFLLVNQYSTATEPKKAEHCLENDGLFALLPDADRDLSDFSSKELSKWLKQQERNVVTFCLNDGLAKSEQREEEPCEAKEDTFSILQPFTQTNCQLESSKWTGAFDKARVPKGPGTLKRANTQRGQRSQKDRVIEPSKSESSCLSLHDGIDSFHGRFIHGQPNGRGKITFEYDSSILDGPISQGRFQGKVTLTSKSGRLQGVFLYDRGLAHGPAWLFPKDSAKEGYIQVFFRRGRIVPYPVVHFDADADAAVGQGIVGRLVNGTFLDNARPLLRKKVMTDYHCMKVVMTGQLEEKSNDANTLSRKRLPIVIKDNGGKTGRVLIRNGNTLVFNRIAKTGSQAFIELLVQLQSRNGIKPMIQLKQVEQLMEGASEVAAFVAQVDSAAAEAPKAWIRHYNFVEFEKYGAEWSPIFINVVRDPVERIISWFYYWRAAWNIVERKIAYPNEPMPDPEFLRKDFDTCVLTGDAECQYVEGTNILAYPDHRSQVMSFCGHEPHCSEFNGERALLQAKANVDKYYAVVGILEDVNKTLSVMEYQLPDVFRGAQKLYHSNKQIRRKMNRNAYKLPVRPEVMDIVRKNFTRELEFYDFCKQRLDAQFKSRQKG